jgi:enoyl-CoA hydratase/carnithine racemase
MTPSPCLTRTDHPGGIVEIGLNRAPVNALSAPMLMEFAALLTALGGDPQVRAILMTSPFKVFSAGLDLKEAQHFDLAQQQAIVEGLDVGFLALFSCPKPTVAAIGGAAIAGGLFFVLASDFRVAGPRARFGLAEVRVGVDFPTGPMEIARATLNANLLRRLMLTGQPIDANAARDAGVVDVIADGDLGARAMAEAQSLAALPPQAYASVKRQIRGDTIARIKAGMRDAKPGAGWYSDETAAAMRAMIG